MKTGRKTFGSWVILAGFFAGASGSMGVSVLDFEEISIPGGTDIAFFTPYSRDGFTLNAVNPSTGFNSGFDAHGPNSILFMGSQALMAFAPASSPPDNLISLSQDNGGTFSLLSIDLARNFPFDPAPTVTFTGQKHDGSSVSETFLVTTTFGTRAFQTFNFSGFTDLDSVSWGQPEATAGLHQFDNIHLVSQTSAVPDQAGSLVLLLLGVSGLWAFRYTSVPGSFLVVPESARKI